MQTFKQSLKVLAVAAGIIGFVSSAFGTWTYSSKTLTDGDWTLNCTPSGTSITINSIKTAGSAEKTLDFSDVADGYSVTTLANNALKNVNIAKVILPNTVTSIGSGTFAGATGLKEVVLSESLTTIGGSAFDGCTALTKVTPLLPESVTSLGCYAFRNCSLLEGDVVLGSSDTTRPFSIVPASTTYAAFYKNPKITSFTLKESCFANSGIVRAFAGAPSNTTEPPIGVTNLVIKGNATQISDYVFRYWIGLKTVTLPETIEKIGTSAFSNCTSLEKVVPSLPANLSYMGNSAFHTCSNLSGDFYIATNAATASCTFGLNSSSNGFQFNDCSLINSFTFGPAVVLPRYFSQSNTGIRKLVFLGTVQLGSKVLAGNTGVTEVEFYGDQNWVSDTFSSWTAYQSRFVIPADNPTWQMYCGSETTMVPASKFTAAETNAYIAAYGTDDFPIGYTKANPAKQWIVARKIDIAGKHPLVVRGILDGKDVDFGVTDPAYGEFEDVKLPFSCTVNEYVTNGLTLYRCQKYVIDEYDPDNTVWINAVTNMGVVYEHNPAQDGVKYRISWIWEPVAYRANVVLPEGGFGTVTETSTPDLHGFYTPGSMMSYEVSGSAPFVRWYGDVPEGQVDSSSIALTSDGERTLYPYFVSNWVYSATAKTITDGYWTINVKANGTALTLDSVKKSGLPILGLAKPVSDGMSDYQITAVANYLIRYSTLVNYVTLPETLASVATESFAASGIKSIVPFLPDSLTSIGASSFNPESSGGGPIPDADVVLRLGFGGQTTIGGSAFRYLGSKEVHFGDKGIAFSGDTSFQYAQAGTRFYWHGNPPTGMQNNTFGGSTKLKTIWYVPRGNEAWATYLGSAPTTPTAADLETFSATFPGESAPKFKFTLYGMRGNYAWLKYWSPKAGMKLLFR